MIAAPIARIAKAKRIVKCSRDLPELKRRAKKRWRKSLRHELLFPERRVRCARPLTGRDVA